MTNTSRREFSKGLASLLTVSLGSVFPAIAYVAPGSLSKQKLQPHDLIIKRASNLSDLLADIDDVARKVNSAKALVKEDTAIFDARKKFEIITSRDDNAYLLAFNANTVLFTDYVAQLNAQGFSETFAIPSSGNKNMSLLPTTEKGFYIQVSANKSDENAIKTAVQMKKSGAQNTSILSDIVNDEAYVKTLVGPYATQDEAKKTADALLKKQEVTDMINDDELLITSLGFNSGKTELQLEDVARETRPVDVSYSDMKAILLNEIARRKPRELRQGKKHYELDELEAMLHSAVDKVNQTAIEKVDYEFVKTLTYIETGFNPYAVATGIKKVYNKKTKKMENKRITLGMGVMQVLKSTAKQMTGENYSDNQMFNPEINMFVGVQYVAHLLTVPEIKAQTDPKEKQRLLFAAYNAGEGALKASEECPGERIFECGKNTGYSETRNYTKKASRTFEAVEQGQF